MKMTRRFFLGGVSVVTIVTLSKSPKPKPYATVWGVGHDLEPIKHEIWQPTSVMEFSASWNIEKFKEITEWEWGFELPKEYVPRNEKRSRIPKELVIRPSIFNREFKMGENGFSNIVSLGELEKHQKSRST